MPIKAASLSATVHVMHDGRDLILYTDDGIGGPHNSLRLDDAAWRALRGFVADLGKSSAEQLGELLQRMERLPFETSREAPGPENLSPDLPMFHRIQAE